MNEERASEILKDSVGEDGGLYSLGWYLGWDPGDDEATLDGRFSAEELEAIAFYMKNNRAPRRIN